MDKSRFYVKRYSGQQMGLYKLLILKHKIPVETVIECIEDFRVEFTGKMDFASSSRQKKYWTEQRIRVYVLELISEYFDTFIYSVTQKTGKKFGMTWKRPKRTYEDDYAEASMDGSLAYNGVTEDF